MPKVALPMGLVVGALAFTTVITPNLLTQPHRTIVQAQSAEEQSVSTSQETLEGILNDIAQDVQVNRNQILFKFEDQSLLLVTDKDFRSDADAYSHCQSGRCDLREYG